METTVLYYTRECPLSALVLRSRIIAWKCTTASHTQRMLLIPRIKARNYNTGFYDRNMLVYTACVQHYREGLLLTCSLSQADMTGVVAPPRASIIALQAMGAQCQHHQPPSGTIYPVFLIFYEQVHKSKPGLTGGGQHRHDYVSASARMSCPGFELPKNPCMFKYGLGTTPALPVIQTLPFMAGRTGRCSAFQASFFSACDRLLGHTTIELLRFIHQSLKLLQLLKRCHLQPRSRTGPAPNTRLRIRSCCLHDHQSLWRAQAEPWQHVDIGQRETADTSLVKKACRQGTPQTCVKPSGQVISTA